eukprot:CAMPEP_0197633130 /NCGR_PEP_ID=MMETSP1338-20131121/9558_1 /TAXON_ID=43686 ORGANISM="Pelagodinium beii, Strain RCC1491" /NCGR_SAMPLE_ID=MMETSP1338 /ASSEMBLY_ACC=CAM_ASM_000754 /LENGTH=336 /DNA_ID=CAMNT_0043204723 /DNA_START=62 /DNA_END=1072 /DNA_ORIENTATION=-
MPLVALAAATLRGSPVHSTQVDWDAAYFEQHRDVWQSLWKIGLAVTNSPTSPGSQQLHEQTHIDGWAKVKEYSQIGGHGHGKDSMAIYKAGEQCILTFSATDSLSEDCKGEAEMSVDDFDVSWADCQVQNVHWCLAAETQTLLVDPAWNLDFYPYLMNNCAAVHVTGHSLGGTIAGIFAACSNGARNISAGVDLPASTKSEWIPGGQVHLPHVSSLTTFGTAAPSLSDTPLTNHLSEDGAFEGVRFFAESNSWRDGISGTLPGHLVLAHPRGAAVRLRESGLIFVEYEARLANKSVAIFQPGYPDLGGSIFQTLQPVHFAYGRLLRQTGWKFVAEN